MIARHGVGARMTMFRLIPAMFIFLISFTGQALSDSWFKWLIPEWDFSRPKNSESTADQQNTSFQPTTDTPVFGSLLEFPMLKPSEEGQGDFSTVTTESQKTKVVDPVKEYSTFLRMLNGPDIVCRAMLSLFGSSGTANCTQPVNNDRKTVQFKVTTTNSAQMQYVIDLIGKSSELALKSPYWVERHRIWVSFGFDARLEPSILVFGFESMVRTTPELIPVRDELFEYIERKDDSLLQSFKDEIRQAIKSTLDEAYRTTRLSAKQ
jgi:hypothetical protein